MLEQKPVANVPDNGESAVPRGRGGADWTERVVAANQWERQHEAEWVRIDQKLREVAVRRAALDAEETRLLRYAEELKLWLGWGFGSMVVYMERVMGYAPHTARERLRVARALAELPLIEDALERGELAHSAVRELSRVAVPETEAAWLEAAQSKCLREIEATVAGHKPGDLPEDPTEPRLHKRTITLELSPESYDLWRRLHALTAEEHGQRLSDDELIPALFRRAYGDGSHVGRTGAFGTSRVPANTSEFAPDASSAVADTAARAPITPSTVSNTGALASAASGTVTDSNAPAPVTPGASADTSAHALGTSSTSAGAIDANATTAGTSADAGDGTGTAGAPRTVGVSGSPAYKIALKQCPDCGRAWQFTGGRDIEVGPAVIELAACDAVRLGSLDAVVPERATTTVTPRKREQVLARDGYCCTVPGCRRNIGLDLHHVEYQSRGGGHRLSNLTTLCDLHHRAVHFEKLAIRGAAPDRLTFEFRTPRDRQNITDDDEPWRATTESGSEGRAESAGRHCVLDDASHGDRGANR